MRLIPHYLKGNTTAASARLAELRFRERDSLVTPPEKLPSWNSRRMVVERDLASAICGDPVHTRSALGGFEQQGKPVGGDDDFLGKGSNPSKPRAGSVIHWTVGDLGATALAIMAVRGCRFPIGEIGSKEFHFCNSRREPGKAYCPAHAAVCAAGKH
jgi:hypothetical protein